MEDAFYHKNARITGIVPIRITFASVEFVQSFLAKTKSVLILAAVIRRIKFANVRDLDMHV